MSTELDFLFKERWQFFAPEEIFSLNALNEIPHKLCPHSMDCLCEFRRFIDAPIIVNSDKHRRRGVRTYLENRMVGGAKESMHLTGRAFDISSPTIDVIDLYDLVMEFGEFKGVGIYNTFIHIDTRFQINPTIWDMRKQN